MFVSYKYNLKTFISFSDENDFFLKILSKNSGHDRKSCNPSGEPGAALFKVEKFDSFSNCILFGFFTNFYLLLCKRLLFSFRSSCTSSWA
jgi:hypothetical protein